MKNVLNQLIFTRCSVIVHKDQIPMALETLNKHGIRNGLSVYDLEWLEAPMWCIEFGTNRKMQDVIERKLKEKPFEELIIVTDKSWWGRIKKLV